MLYECIVWLSTARLKIIWLPNRKFWYLLERAGYQSEILFDTIQQIMGKGAIFFSKSTVMVHVGQNDFKQYYTYGKWRLL